jgi:rhamnose utilization protein RhaD (predicted bifunctional aldolase and dehydrogenase)
VGNAGLEKFLALRLEAVAGVEPERMRLGVQDDAIMPGLAGHHQQFRQERTSHPVPAPCGEHGHAPDVAVGQQAAGANRLSVARRCQHVQAERIELVPLERERHALLADEDVEPHLLQARSIFRPQGAAQRKVRHAGDYNCVFALALAMDSLWNDDDAARCADELQLRAYTSRLLGRERALVLHGGGNTSVKLVQRNLFGEEEARLYVKGSGADLAQVSPADFTPLRLHDVRRLIGLEALGNAELMDAVGTCLAGAGPRPSIETLLHACLPWKYVEHTHADSVLAITNTANGERIARQVFGQLAPLVPFRHSGFALAKACDAVYREQATAATIGLILLHHGVFAFGSSARESYENMLRLVSLAEDYLASHGAWELPCDAASDADRWSLPQIAGLRREVSRTAGFPLIMTQQDDAVWRAFARRQDLAALCGEGPATPQHAVFAKRMPLIGTDLARYAREYAEHVAANHAGASPGDLGLDPAPRVIVDPQLGVWTAGIDAHYAGVTAEIFRHDVEIMSRAQAHDVYAGLPPAAILDAEIHYGGFERRLRAAGGERVALLGEVCLLAGAGSALDDALVEVLSGRGAAVAMARMHRERSESVLQLPPQAAAGLRQLVSSFGGLDVLVLMDGSLAWLEPCVELLALAPRGGRIVVVDSDDGHLLARARTLAAATSLAVVEVQPGVASPRVQAQLIAGLCEPAAAALAPTLRLGAYHA